MLLFSSNVRFSSCQKKKILLYFFFFTRSATILRLWWRLQSRNAKNRSRTQKWSEKKKFLVQMKRCSQSKVSRFNLEIAFFIFFITKKDQKNSNRNSGQRISTFGFREKRGRELIKMLFYEQKKKISTEFLFDSYPPIKMMKMEMRFLDLVLKKNREKKSKWSNSGDSISKRNPIAKKKGLTRQPGRRGGGEDFSLQQTLNRKKKHHQQTTSIESITIITIKASRTNEREREEDNKIDSRRR